MFRLSYTAPYEGKVKKLKLTSDPFYYGLGNYKDVDGNLWNVGGLYGSENKVIVQARPVDGSHPLDRTDTAACFAPYSAEWVPYELELKESKKR